MTLPWTHSDSSMPFLYYQPQEGMQISRWSLTRVQLRGRITSFYKLAMLLCMQPRVWLSFWVASAHCQLKSNFSFTCIPKPFSSGLLSIHLSHILYWYRGLSQPKCRTCLVELHEFFPLKPVQALCMASLLSSVSTAPLSLVSPTNLLQVCSVPLSVPLTKILNRFAHNMDL